MNSELKNAIREQFKDVLSCSIDVGDGWHALVSDMLFDMTNSVKAAGFPRDHLRVTSIKEKYGTLRCYYDAPLNTASLEDIVERYELRSACTCETCGRIGRLRGKEYFKTLCDECVAGSRFDPAELRPENLPEGAHIQIVSLENDQVEVKLKDIASADREFSQRAHRNDIPLAVYDLLNEMLQHPASADPAGEAQKIVIAEYGVFEPGEDAIRAYAARKGLEIHDAVTHWMFRHYWKVPADQRPENPDSDYEKRYLFDPKDIPRDDADLVAVVEEMGEAANTKHCTLAVVEVPYGVKWYIDTETLSFGEQVAEQHRTWR